MEDDLARRRRQRRASAEFKELSKAEADGRNHASQCRAAAESYERAARRLQLVPSTAKNAEGTNYRLDLGVADADALEAAAAVAYLLMRYYGNRGEVGATELWGLRAQPLPPTLAKETEHYLAQQAERLKNPCLAARRWRSLSQHHVAVRDRLGEHLARLRFHFPEATCVVLASPQTP